MLIHKFETFNKKTPKTQCKQSWSEHLAFYLPSGFPDIGTLSFRDLTGMLQKQITVLFFISPPDLNLRKGTIRW